MSGTILIVEDDEELHELYVDMLDSVDCQIVRARDGTDALDELEARVPDLIILDIILDEMMGDEFLEIIRGKPRFADIPVIIVSVLPAERCQELLTRHPNVRFLRKPFRKMQLQEAVESSLAKSRRS